MTSNGTSGYVPSLDGLRTVAVGLVIAFHLGVPWMEPGFAGVDVFFVLSGYLITAGLLADQEANGRPRLARFWRRRFLRLLPAATLLLLAVLAYSTLRQPLFQRGETAGDVGWTAVYLGNWHFMGANSYFDDDGVPRILLHMWSLAVEEQFYLVWPVVITAVALLTRGRVRRALLWLTAGLIVASALLLVVLYDPAAPDRSYMGTDSKAFEPLLGAGLAVVLAGARGRRLFAAQPRLTAGVGILLAVAVLPFLGGPSDAYFHGGALVLTLGVTLLIGALVAQPGMAAARLLAWAPLAYLGRISYGLYLWHWPWAVWLGVAHAGTLRPLPAVVALVATVATAAASYHLVEQPIRRGGIGVWLTPRRLVVAVAIVMAVVLGWSSALRATHGIGRDTRVIVATGDSVPMKMMTPLDRAATARGWAIDSAARGGCTPLAIELQQYLEPPHEGAGDCRGVAAIQDSLIDRYDPDIVFWWSRYEWHQRWLGDRIVGPWDEEFWPALEADVARTVDRLTRDGAILVIGRTERPGPGLFAKCAPGATDCYPLDDVALNHDEYRRRWNDMVADLAATDPRVRSFDLDPLICNDAEPAQAVSPAACDDRQADGGLLRPDGVHIQVDPYGRPTAERVIDAVLAAAQR